MLNFHAYLTSDKCVVIFTLRKKKRDIIFILPYNFILIFHEFISKINVSKLVNKNKALIKTRTF